MNKNILKLAIPNILSNVSIPLLASVDVAIAGRIGDATYLAALSITGFIFSMLYWSLGFLRMGTVGLTAQSIGANNHQETASIIIRGLIVAGIISFFLLVFRMPIASGLLQLSGASEDLSKVAIRYYSIFIWAAPATLMSYVIHGWLLGLQDSVRPMIMLLITNVGNVVISWYLVYRMDMDIEGIALGSTISQYVGLLLGLGFVLYSYLKRQYTIDWKHVFNLSKLLVFFQLNLDIWLRTICLVIAFFFFNKFSIAIGEEYLAVNEVLSQYIIWTAFTIDGLANAAEALVGKNIGEKKYSLVHLYAYRIMWWAFFISLGYFFLFFFFNTALIQLFTNIPSVIELAQSYVWWLILMPFAGFVCFIWDGVFIGMTWSKAVRDPMLIALGFFIATAYLTKNSLGNHGLWLAWTVFLLVRGIIQTYYWVFLRKKHLLTLSS